MFHDRIDAGLQLAKKLRKYKDSPGIILAVPRGGVVVAYTVAKELDLPMDLILVKKLGHPMNKEYAIGAVSLTDEFVIPDPGASQEYVDEEIDRIRRSLKKMYPKFSEDEEVKDWKGKTIIVIDDGIATGNTLLVTVRMLKKKEPSKIVIAVPVASADAIQKLSKEVDDVVSVLEPEIFSGVDSFYENFEQVTDNEVIYYLERLRREMKKVG
ncbi:MAG: phosphoribosyltransferase [Chitinophagales bacterium]